MLPFLGLQALCGKYAPLRALPDIYSGCFGSFPFPVLISSPMQRRAGFCLGRLSLSFRNFATCLDSSRCLVALCLSLLRRFRLLSLICLWSILSVGLGYLQSGLFPVSRTISWPSVLRIPQRQATLRGQGLSRPCGTVIRSLGLLVPGPAYPISSPGPSLISGPLGHGTPLIGSLTS